ncbi:MAG: DUF6361 family protein [Hyphomicrobiales bacterium]
MSAFVWLDYSERERRRMLDVVDQFREHDTRDELGIGSVRDAFADLLFPGTSTIMTRARYFLLVPWMYRRQEKLRTPSAQIAARARRAEIDLVDAIEQSDDKEGNIGKVAKTTLKRLPSSVYWQGLSIWGIRTFRGAQAQYHRSLDRYYAQLTRHSGRVSERDIEHDDLIQPNWHGGLIPPPLDFPTKCTLSLTCHEAEYLTERIRLSPACSGSLLAELAAQRRRSADVPFAWKHPYSEELQPKLRVMLNHAQNFSEIMHGAPLLYNLILAEQDRREESIKRYRQDLTEWAQMMSERSRVLVEWSRERFWQLIHTVNPRITNPTHEFINTWWDFALAGDAARLCDSPVVRSLIRDRERRLKKSLARIDNPRAQELWTGDSGTAQLEFRWLISQRLLGDIFDGLETADA